VKVRTDSGKVKLGELEDVDVRTSAGDVIAETIGGQVTPKDSPVIAGRPFTGAPGCTETASVVDLPEGFAQQGRQLILFVD